jgi:hypothetical protein
VLIRRSVSVKDAGPLLAARRHAQQAQQAQPAAAPSFTVQHFHYSAWPDHGVPTSPEPLLALCAELRRRGAHASPIVVHCSGGWAAAVVGMLCVTTLRAALVLCVLWNCTVMCSCATMCCDRMLRLAVSQEEVLLTLPCLPPSLPLFLPCAAGIGRSGVFCVLDVITQRLLGLQGCQDAARGAAAVDVAALVADLRCAACLPAEMAARSTCVLFSLPACTLLLSLQHCRAR